MIYAYIHIEKAGGTTINRILRQSFGLRHFDLPPFWNTNDENVMDAFFSAFPFKRSIAGHEVLPLANLNKYCGDVLYYSMFREPIARTISHYQYQILRMNKSLSFEKWAKEKKYSDFQVKKLAGEENYQKAIDILENRIAFAGLLEDFDRSMLLLKQIIPNLDIHYTKKNISKDYSIKNMLLNDPVSMDILNDINKNDIKFYDYVKDVYFERQLKKYNGDMENDLVNLRSSKPALVSILSNLGNVAFRNLYFKRWVRSIGVK